MGRVIIVAMLLISAVAGGAIYYLQVYAYYEEVQADADAVKLTSTITGLAEPLAVANFQGIDAASSPLRYRACFETSVSQAELVETYVVVDNNEPRIAPAWFDCFDAARIGADLQAEAVAFLGIRDVQYGIDRIVAIYPDGRGYAWHEINPCGEVVFEGNPPPEGCPPLPDRAE